jgi:hypothetical protein
VPLEDKLKADHEVRYPEEEGLYVGNRLTVTNRNKNKLERRLLAGGDRWAMLTSVIWDSHGSEVVGGGFLGWCCVMYVVASVPSVCWYSLTKPRTLFMETCVVVIYLDGVRLCVATSEPIVYPLNDICIWRIMAEWYTDRGKLKRWQKNMSQCHSVHPNSMWTDPGMNLGLCDERLASLLLRVSLSVGYLVILVH